MSNTNKPQTSLVLTLGSRETIALIVVVLALAVWGLQRFGH